MFLCFFHIQLVCETIRKQTQHTEVIPFLFTHSYTSLLTCVHPSPVSTLHLLAEDDAGRTGDSGTLAPLALRKELGDIPPPAALAAEGVDAAFLGGDIETEEVAFSPDGLTAGWAEPGGFLPSPLGGAAAARGERCGDLGRCNANGSNRGLLSVGANTKIC
jgi:hypothetical protein